MNSTLLGADGHVMVATAAPPHLLECPQQKLTLAGPETVAAGDLARHPL
jgi:hypothetical protein